MSIEHASLTITANGNTYVTNEVVGRGSFGVVFKATCENDNSTVAIKKVLQDQRFKVSRYCFWRSSNRKIVRRFFIRFSLRLTRLGYCRIGNCRF